MSGEVARKLLHLAVGLPALLLGWLTWWQAALVALSAVLYNGFAFKRIHGDQVFREAERPRGFAKGLVYYPLSVLLLILVFHDQLIVAGVGWVVLAFGDGLATLVGRFVGGPRLPWNHAKSWSGTLAFALFGSTAAAAVALFLAEETLAGVTLTSTTLIVGAVVAAVVAAVVESVDSGVDDNLLVPMVSAATFWLAIRAPSAVWTSHELWQQAVLGVLVAGVTGGLAFLAKSVDLRGLLAGIAIGTAVYTGGGTPGFLTLFTFFVLGVGATRVGFRHKAERGLAEARGGRRSAIHAIANGAVGAFAALAAALIPDLAPLLLIAFAGAFATAAADTVSSEIGKRYGRRAFQPTTFRAVPTGTEGAISVEGTLAGLVAAVVVALVAALGLVITWPAALWVTLAAIIGNHLESLAGHLVGAKDEIDNEVLNFLNTLAGAVIAVGLSVGAG